MKKDKSYLALAAQIPCIVCCNNGFQGTPAELHHPRRGVGMGLKSSDHDVIALCPIHHRTGGYGEIALHMGIESFEERYGTEEELLFQMKERVRLLQESYIF